MNEIESLKTEIIELKNIIQSKDNEIEELKKNLKKYTAPSRSKKYYESHKEEIKKRNSDYKKRTQYDKNIDPEKKKEKNRIAYIKRKNKQNIINGLHTDIS